MADTPLHYQTITEVAAKIRSREISPVELTQALLDRIAALDGRLKSYATVMAEPAMASAQAAEEEIADGRYRGALHGVPIAVKDLCFTTGVATTGGLQVLRDFVPDFDGTVVRRLNDAGAIILGKLNLTEGAMAGYNPSEIVKTSGATATWISKSFRVALTFTLNAAKVPRLLSKSIRFNASDSLPQCSTMC